MKLYLDTTDRYKKIIRLLDGNKVINELVIDSAVSGGVVPGVEKLLKASIRDNLLSGHNGLELRDIIDRVDVNAGPGSFTGLRVGVSIANALNYVLGNLKKDFSNLIIPHYGKEPNISKPRKR